MVQGYSNWFVRARLKTRQLLLLAAMEEEGNVRRAADVLGMTQPAASRLLKELEDVLEVSLFDRTSHGMRATLYGEVMIRHARMVLSNLSQAHDEISALRAGLAGKVHWRRRELPTSICAKHAIAEVVLIRLTAFSGCSRYRQREFAGIPPRHACRPRHRFRQPLRHHHPPGKSHHHPQDRKNHRLG